jgi:hypothetical protein
MSMLDAPRRDLLANLAQADNGLLLIAETENEAHPTPP